MRIKTSNQGITALAIAGSYVVLIGWDMPKTAMRLKGVLGFAIQRTRHKDGEIIWLSGMKTFASVDPSPMPGLPVSSFKHPLQTFQWADYSVSPNHKYTYRVVAMTGIPSALIAAASVELSITTERTDLGKHAVFFNRGAIASQAYALRFQNRKPSEVGQAAYDWLSRGLVESLEAFIAQAGAGDALYGAFFEFKNSRIHQAIKQAKARAATIKVLYDGDSQLESNQDALQNSGIKSLTKPRTRSGRFAHNKFLVLRQAGKSTQVWTGSVNLSENGLFGHSNNAHLLRDEDIAEQYYQYWRLLNKDLTVKPTATAADAATPIPAGDWQEEVLPVFSPRRTLGALDWYAQLASGAQRGLFATFAFGMNERFVKAYDKHDKVLRFALMEKKGNGRTFRAQAADIDRIRKLPNVTVAVGHKVELNNFDRWLTEIDKIADEAHVLYIHTKYMLIDPLGPMPIVIVGSANFSNASTDTNDENMLVIQGNSEVADIYLGEFMRLYSHYAFRESLSFKGASAPLNLQRRKHLWESWQWINGDAAHNGYFAAGSERALRRLYFSGQ